MIKKITLLFFISCLCFSCALLNKKPELDSLSKGKKMNIKTFFNGEIEGFSILQDSNGKITDTRITKFSGKWDDNKGLLKQEYTDSSGKRENRTWLITLYEDDGFDAIGHDLISPASGSQSGNAAMMIYTLSEVENKIRTKIRYEDKMYLVDDKSMIMISKIYNGKYAGKKITSLKKISNKTDAKMPLVLEEKKPDNADSESELKAENNEKK